MNELSSTIDLQSTLITAEGLFHRFERTVQAVDKKDLFPAPGLLRRNISGGADAGPSQRGGRQDQVVKKDGDDDQNEGATGRQGKKKDNDRRRVVDADNGSGKGEEKKAVVISPELRALLRRDLVGVKEGKKADQGK